VSKWADVEMGGITSFYFAMPTFDERESDKERVKKERDI
jgi:hypothetical protein